MTDASHDDPTDPSEEAAVEGPGLLRVHGPHVGIDPADGSGAAPGVAELVLPSQGRVRELLERRRRMAAAAVLAAAGLVVVVVVAAARLLSVDASSPELGGADSPSEALIGLVEGILDGDPGAAGGFVAPAERAAMTDAGLDLLAELEPLVGLSDGRSVADFAGADVSAIGLRVSAEPVRSGNVGLSFALGSVQGTVDVADLGPATILSSWLPADWLATAPAETVVAVQVDGRWHVSVWHTLAEHVRTISEREPPDADKRPPAIGAVTPSAAAEAVMAELLGLDARRLIGMLDPREASAIYDYAPLFAAEIDAIANRLLAERDSDGFVWDSLTLDSTASVDADIAVVTPERVQIRGSGATMAVEIDLDATGARIQLSGRDIWDEPVDVELSAAPGGRCDVSANGNRLPAPTQAYTRGPSAPGGEGSADEAPASAAQQLCSADLARPSAMVFREVDGRWYLSPTLTAARGSLGLLELLGLAGLGEVIAEVLVAAGAPEPLAVLDLDEIEGAPAAQPDASDQTRGLLSPRLGDPSWSYLMTSTADVHYEMSLWVSGLAIDASSGIYAFFEESPQEGGTAVVVLETASEQAAADALGGLAARSEPADEFVPGALFVLDALAPTVLVAVDGPLFVLAGSLGADLNTIGDLLAAQLQG